MGTRFRWAAFGLVLGCVLTSGAFMVLRSYQVPTLSARQSLSPPTVLKQIQQLSELVSVKYSMQKVVGFEEKKVPVGTEKILLFVQAEVISGIELDKLANPGRPPGSAGVAVEV